ncbi:MAG: hypothetical protein ABIK62_05340, partial [candidate division WOR-3 bacterium]
ASDKLYCINNGSSDAYVIDCNSNSVVTRIPTQSEPTALCLEPGTNRVFVANNFGSSISVIRDTLGGGVLEEARALPRVLGARARFVRDSFSFPKQADLSDSQAYLFDVSGRRVLKLCPGLNVLSRLSGGVYLVFGRFAGAGSEIHRPVGFGKILVAR